MIYEFLLVLKSSAAYNKPKREAGVVGSVQRLYGRMSGQRNVQQCIAARVLNNGRRLAITATAECLRRQYTPTFLPALHIQTHTHTHSDLWRTQDFELEGGNISSFLCLPRPSPPDPSCHPLNSAKESSERICFCL